MKNFRILLSMISRNNDMEMPEHGDKAKAYKVMGIIAMCCIMIPCCIVVGFIVYIMTAKHSWRREAVQRDSTSLSSSCRCSALYSV